jgi:hypothetical protein
MNTWNERERVRKRDIWTEEDVLRRGKTKKEIRNNINNISSAIFSY